MANRLTWIPSTAPDIAHYDVYRGPSSTGSWTFLTGVLDQPRTSASFSGTVFFYVDASGTTSSWYRLDAVDSSSLTGTSVFSAIPAAPSGGNVIAWEPSLDPTVTPYGSYIIEAARQVSGPWYVVNQIPAALLGQYYVSGANRFAYRDGLNPYNTWYHIIDVDAQGHMSRPSDPFLTHPMPYFVPGSTPFGIFDNDAQFAHDADQIADFVRKKLGEPVMEVHMSSSQIYAAFEEACLEYSAMVNSYQAQSVLATFLGAPTGTLSGSENKYPVKTLALAKNIADPFSTEADLNSRVPVYTGSIQCMIGQQSYDVPEWLRTHDTQGNLVVSGSSSAGLPAQWNGSGTIVLREVYHKSPMAAYRFFGTTSGLNYLNNQFRFESFTPETLFYLLPIWEDILRGMQFKTSNTVRRSNYSYDVHNNQLRLFPVPQQQYLLWFTFTVDSNPTNVVDYQPNTTASMATGATSNPAYSGVANLSNIPFGNIQYSQLNSISKHWIRRMSLALSKEIEGLIRSKMTTIPIPNGDLTLNGPELVADARTEIEGLRAELRDILGETTYQKLVEKEAAMAQQLQETWKGVPLGIYCG